MKKSDVIRYQEKMKIIKSNGFKAKDFKELGREMQQEFPELSVPQITAVLNNRLEEIFEILD